VVAPSDYYSQILNLVHDNLISGHLGITKTYSQIFKHFFWPGLKSDIVKYCHTFHVCQFAGKPNEVIPPAPLPVQPIPVVGGAI